MLLPSNRGGAVSDTGLTLFWRLSTQLYDRLAGANWPGMGE